MARVAKARGRARNGRVEEATRLGTRVRRAREKSPHLRGLRGSAPKVHLQETLFLNKLTNFLKTSFHRTFLFFFKCLCLFDCNKYLIQ